MVPASNERPPKILTRGDNFVLMKRRRAESLEHFFAQFDDGWLSVQRDPWKLKKQEF